MNMTKQESLALVLLKLNRHYWNCVALINNMDVFGPWRMLIST